MNALDDNLSIAATLPETPVRKPRNVARTLAKNSAANVTRLAITSLVSIFLPAYLTHHLPVTTYGAWVLILQLSAYVGYLDFGVQTAVSKYIAEYEAKQDYAGCGRCASVGLRIMLIASALGVLLTVILAWRVPAIFRTMPHSLYHDVRVSVLFIGVSLAATLGTSVFAAIFLGLQRYQVPMVITIASRLLFGVVICAAVAMHSGLIAMGAAAACVNILTALTQIAAWRKLANHIRVSLGTIDVGMLQQMLKYCAVLTVWSVCMLFVSGLDIAIVGRYSFGETAYYSIANSPTSLVLMISAALIGPLLPATSALSVQRTGAQMGSILLRSTRYATIVLLLLGLPLVVGGYGILRLWVGPTYALHSLQYLRVLVLANIVRNVCSPYATMVVAISKQKAATAAAVAEGTVNLVSSIWLAQHIGALGVAAGTMLGAVVGVAVHFGVSMRYTRQNLAISRTDLFVKGMLRPGLIALPSIALILPWWQITTSLLRGVVYCAWLISTLLLAWCVSMSRGDREVVVRLAKEKLAWS
jgi:O-antigen/teichoic acid export membrane protein